MALLFRPQEAVSAIPAFTRSKRRWPSGEGRQTQVTGHVYTLLNDTARTDVPYGW
jgi:hypothetical protein